MVNAKVTVLGIILFAVFVAFQLGYAAPLGQHAWLVGVILLTVLLWAIGGSMSKKKPSADVKMFWNFAVALAVVSTIIISYAGPWLGAVAPASLAAATPLVISFWLVVYGGAHFVHGWWMKDSGATFIGVFWLFSALHFVTAVSTGPNSYVHLGLVAGLPYILWGLLKK